MSKSPDEITKALAEPFPPQALKRRNDRGSTFTYVEGHTVFRRLIDATGNRFDVQVMDQSIQPYGQTSKGADRVIITARVRLTIPELGSREHMGVQVTSIGSGEDLYKGAISDAIKKAATLFGVGLELYGPDYEAGEIEDRPVSPQPAPRRDTARSARNAPRSDATSVQASEDPDDPQRLLAALHAAAAKYDIDHDALHAYFAIKGYASVKDAPFDRVRDLTAWLNKGNPHRARDREKVQETFRVAVMENEARLAAGEEPASRMDDEDYAQVMASIEIDAESGPTNAELADHYAS